MRQKLLLLAAVFFGILAFVFTYQQINAEKAKIRKSAIMLDVIMLKKTLSAGEEITEEHLAPKTVPRSLDGNIANEIRWGQRNRIIGRKVNTMIEAGRILSWYVIDASSEESGKTGLTARIGEGDKRAVGLSVNSVSNLSGLIRPNNRVDVIGTFNFPDIKDPKLRMVTLTILQNVKVLACDSDMGNQEASGRSARGYNVITLEIDASQMELFAFATRYSAGITLALRRHDNGRIEQNLPLINMEDFLRRQNSVRTGN